jgi:hypothetical protein
MATTDTMQVSVKWSGKAIIHPTFYRFNVSWLRRTSARELLIHVLAEVYANLSLDDVEEISLKKMQHVNEGSPTRRTKRGAYLNKIDATRLLDDDIYDIMQVGQSKYMSTFC